MIPEQIKLSRKELYEKVWSIPMTIMAKELGIKYQYLKTVCQENNIPVPVCGHWTKIRNGIIVKQPALPELAEMSDIDMLQKTKHPKLEMPKDKLMANSKYSEEGVRLKKSLRNPHYLIIEAKNSINEYSREFSGLIRPHCSLDIATSPRQLNRAFRILNTIIKYFERRGNKAEKNYIIFDKVKIPIAIREKYTREVIGKEQHRYKEYKYTCSGKLIFEIKLYSKLTWMDSENVQIEQRLRHIIETITKCAISEEIGRQQREEEARIGKLEEERRAAERRKEEQEREKCEQLTKDALLWDKCCKVRGYLDAVRENALKKYGCIEEGSELDLWLKWGVAYADHIDPLPKVVG